MSGWVVGQLVLLRAALRHACSRFLDFLLCISLVGGHFSFETSTLVLLDLLEPVLAAPDGLPHLLHGLAEVLLEQALLVRARQQRRRQAEEVQQEEVVDPAAHVGDGQQRRQRPGEVEERLALLGLAADGPGAARRLGRRHQVGADLLEAALLVAGPALGLEDLEGKKVKSVPPLHNIVCIVVHVGAGGESTHFLFNNVRTFLKPTVTPPPPSPQPPRTSFGFLGSLVSKDGRSDISRILMPLPLSHCRVMSQDPSSRSRYPPPGGDSIQVLPAVSFWKRNATD